VRKVLGLYAARLSTHDLGSCEYVRKVLGLYAAPARY